MKVYMARADLKFNFNGYDFEVKKGEKLLFAEDVFALLPQNLKELFKEEKVGFSAILSWRKFEWKDYFNYCSGSNW